MKQTFAYILGAAILISVTAQAQAHNAFERALLARSDVTHLWEMNDNPNGCVVSCTPGPCTTGVSGTNVAADSIAAGATAVPSPVSLVAIYHTPQPVGFFPACGMPPIYFGGGTSISLCIGACQTSSISPFMEVPTSAMPGLPFTMFCVLNPAPQSNQAAIWNWTIGGVQPIEAYLQGSKEVTLAGSVIGTHNLWVYNGKMFVVVSASTGSQNMMVNGLPMLTIATTAPSPTPGPGSFGADSISAGNHGFSGTMADCGYANTAWSLSTVQSLWAILNQNGSF